MKALIIGNGDRPPGEILRSLASGADLVICADGGVHAARDLGVVPDVIIGDFDSSVDEVRRGFKGARIIESSDQNYTDLDKALFHAKKEGVTEVILTGVLGRRLDHQLSNLSSAERFVIDFPIALVDAYGCGIFVASSRQDGKEKIETFAGQTISMFSFCGARGVVTRGLRYPLLNEELQFGKRVSISYVALEDCLEISLSEGILFVYLKNPE